MRLGFMSQGSGTSSHGLDEVSVGNNGRCNVLQEERQPGIGFCCFSST